MDPALPARTPGSPRATAPAPVDRSPPGAAFARPGATPRRPPPTTRRRGSGWPVIAALAGALALGACAAPGPRDSAMPQRLSQAEATELPAPRRFPLRAAPPPARANSDMARDILELGFFMESGRPIPQFSRFEGPITLRMTGTIPPGAAAELDVLRTRLRREAGITLHPAPEGQTAGVTVEFVTRAQLRGSVPQAACFIVPRVSSWAEFRANRRSPRLDWTTLAERQQVAVFIPFDVTPQEVRDCMQEEIAQAIGPINDLYRVPDTVMNDDNFQTVLTGFDMLLLRVWYDPALRSGMTRDEVAARLPAILARLNPRGERIAPGPPSPRSPRAWIEAVESALGPGGSRSTRRAAAERALAIARASDWRDSRLALSYFIMGRLARPSEGDLALASFLQAGMIWRSLPGAEAHAAHVDMQLAAFALSMGQYADAIGLATRAETQARITENAALLASLKMVQAVAHDRMGRRDLAQRLRSESLGWARFGFGTPQRVQERMAEIEALAPPPGSARAQAAGQPAAATTPGGG